MRPKCICLAKVARGWKNSEKFVNSLSNEWPRSRTASEMNRFLFPSFFLWFFLSLLLPFALYTISSQITILVHLFTVIIFLLIFLNHSVSDAFTFSLSQTRILLQLKGPLIPMLEGYESLPFPLPYHFFFFPPISNYPCPRLTNPSNRTDVSDPSFSSHSFYLSPDSFFQAKSQGEKFHRCRKSFLSFLLLILIPLLPFLLLILLPLLPFSSRTVLEAAFL